MIVALVKAGRRVGITANSHTVIGHVLDEVMDAADEAGATIRAMQKADDEERCSDQRVESTKSNAEVEAALQEGRVDVVGGTAWLFARPEFSGTFDHLVVDEAGQLSLANVVAVGGAAENLILVGDPQQLPQPLKGTHPPGAGRSALEHLLDGDETVPDDRGLFLGRTWRMHPEVCSFVSELAYEGRLHSVETCSSQRVGDGPVVEGSGVRWLPVEHTENRTSSSEEVEAIAAIHAALVGRDWTDQHGVTKPMTPADILVVAPYNAQVHLLSERLGASARVGTVDKFQGQEAAVVVVSMTASSAEDVPRGLEFLYSRNRLNVAVSRARAMSIVVGSPTLLAARCRTLDQMRLVNGLCRFVEFADMTPTAM